MNGRAYYGEWDPYCAGWLRGLIDRGLIPPGEIDTRDIRDVRSDDLRGYVQCHFFCGIAGWPLALRLAGFPDDRPCWTGSCPCQRLSSAARGRNVAADLWPAWLPLIAANRPRALFGEQVAHQRAWFDRVCDDLEPLGYEIGAAVLPAVSVGKDHLRPRLFFVGDADRNRQSVGTVDAEASWLPRDNGHAGSVAGAHGVSARVGRLRAYGNAIVPPLAAEFIRAFLET